MGAGQNEIFSALYVSCFRVAHSFGVGNINGMSKEDAWAQNRRNLLPCTGHAIKGLVVSYVMLLGSMQGSSLRKCARCAGLVP